MFMSDTLVLDAPRRTSEGYLAVRARAARAGVQDYYGYEVDPGAKHFQAMDRVPVYRPEDEVFNPASLHSFLMKPITNDHPKQAVTAANWKDHAGGIVAKAIRDGDHVAFDLVLMDQALIADVDAGKRGLSNGYATDLRFEDGTAPDGTPYKAIQRSIAGNHVAVVKAGRAGELARIGDTALCDALPANLLPQTQEQRPMKIKIGDAEVEVTDGAAVAVAVGTLNQKLSDAETKVGTLTGENATLKTSVETKDGEIAALTQKVKDAEVTPAKLQQLADARAQVIGKAKSLKADLVTDGKTDVDIRKEAVTAKLGDAATGMSDAAIEGAFTALTKDAKVEDTTVHPIIAPLIVDADKSRSNFVDRIQNAWKGPQAAAA